MNNNNNNVNNNNNDLNHSDDYCNECNDHCNNNNGDSDVRRLWLRRCNATKPTSQIRRRSHTIKVLGLGEQMPVFVSKGSEEGRSSSRRRMGANLREIVGRSGGARIDP